jgi:uncharacterized protein YjaG (DUF416 family)
MNYDEYKKRITQEADKLNQNEKVVLCLFCCVRLFPLYKKFSEFEDWGSPSILLDTQNAAKRWLRSEKVEVCTLKKCLSEVVPDMDDFGSMLSSFALNAGLAHLHLLEQMDTNNIEPAFYALLSCYDTIDFYVQELLDPDCKGRVSEVEIERHSIMVSEIEWQLAIFNRIKNSKKIESLVDSCEVDEIINV